MSVTEPVQDSGMAEDDAGADLMMNTVPGPAGQRGIQGLFVPGMDGQDGEDAPLSPYANPINYEINTINEQLFLQSISKYWPSIDKSVISPSYSGIRPKLVGIDDFVVKEKVVNDNLMVSILGYESPGLTASLGLAEYVHDICFKTYGFKN